jgi:hypothetical protein
VTQRGTTLAAAIGCVVAIAGCAAGSYSPDVTPSMPAPRQALRAEYRFFYDALSDYGDWILIEPYGYLFRPDVNFVAWRPYTEGYWVPTDIYGWVWVSSEPFGWATYHYGQWGYDRFQGWVWQPGANWGPAWVDWRATEDYVGWAPVMPPGMDPGIVPGGAYVYLPTMQLPSTNASVGILRADAIGAAVARSERVRNLEERDGVTFNRGPSIEAVERVVGPLPRSRLDDLVPRNMALERSAASDTARPGGDDAVERTQQAGVRAAREAKTFVRQGGRAPERLPVVRPLGVAGEPTSPAPRKKPAPAPRKAPPDSAR